MRFKTWASCGAGLLPRFSRPGQTHRQALQDNEATKRGSASLTGHEGGHLNAGAPEARALQAWTHATRQQTRSGSNARSFLVQQTGTESEIPYRRSRRQSAQPLGPWVAGSYRATSENIAAMPGAIPAWLWYLFEIGYPGYSASRLWGQGMIRFLDCGLMYRFRLDL